MTTEVKYEIPTPADYCELRRITGLSAKSEAAPALGCRMRVLQLRFMTTIN